MEYGDAINSETLQRAVRIARQSRAERQEPLQDLAAEAVSQAYCVCVTAGEDAAEHRFSDVHRKLIIEVIERVQMLEATRAWPVSPCADHGMP